jgi:cbb3-type cytochrome oxidase maturation protein
MSENIVILMIGVSTFLGALGLIALLWGVKTGQFDDQSKFIDAARYDGEDELRDAAMMQNKQDEQKKKARQKKKEEEKQKNYMPPD